MTDSGLGRRGRVPPASAGSLALLGVLAYLPSLLSSPGTMPADTKLYLYLDPGGLVSRASRTFEPDQFAGWVPHQQITYLWPSGPYFWLLDTVGIPDWVAHRLWIGTIMFAAGSGVWWAARRLGFGLAGALVAGAVYQLSPYLLPYVSRTSLLLLPWAALGWLVGLTIRATDEAIADPRARTGGRRTAPRPPWRTRLVRWRYPAAIALVVATVGSANATALALVAPAPALWLVHAAWGRAITWRAALGVAARTTVLCVGASLWWVAMLIVQSRHGAPVLAYSETLEDVSRNATGSEALRGLGYWLFYGRDVHWATTTAAIDHLDSTLVLASGYLLALLGMVGLVAVRWPARRFAALAIGVGMFLAVGVHPFDDPAPLVSLLTDDDGSGLALALRSSTRAVPLVVLGLALGAGALVAACGQRRWVWRVTPRTVAAVTIVVLALVNLPALTGRRLVDPALERDEQPPSWWTEAAAAVDGGDDRFRVLQLPGAEFGAFRWGYTVDQPLVGLAGRDLVTRDLLPLGSAGAMDLLYALDDRVQAGILEADAVAPIARWLGVDTILMANDSAFERFRTPRPATVAAQLTGADGLAAPRDIGPPTVFSPEFPTFDPVALGDPVTDRAVPPVQLFAVEDPLPVVRATTGTVLLAGSGDGLVDAAAAGVLDGTELVRYGASFAEEEELAAALGDADALVVTDSNRDRAHHWRGSQDVHGHTEPGGPADDVLTATAADQRLQVFDRDDPDVQTVAVQDGPVRAIASAYGEPFAYRPEHRAVMAIDGDPSTAWLVGDHGDPRGERLRLTLDPSIGGVESIRLQQPSGSPGERSISRVRVEVEGAEPFSVEIGQDEELTIPSVPVGGTIDLVIEEVAEGDPTRRAGRSGVGFAEVDLGLDPTVEYIRPPVAAVRAVNDAGVDPPETTIVLTRLRVDAANDWRDDPEPELRRLVEVPTGTELRPVVEVRLDRRADPATLGGLLADAADGPLPLASDHLAGTIERAGHAAFDGDATTAWMSPFDPSAGLTLTFRADGPVSGALELVQPDGPYSRITGLTISDDAGSLDAVVPAPDANGRSTVDLADAVFEGDVVLTVTALDGRPTIDRRYGDPTVLPVAVADVTGPGVPVVGIDGTTTIEVACSDALLEIDGEVVAVEGATSVASLVAGEAFEATPCDGDAAIVGGEHRLVTTASGSGLTVDRVVLTTEGAPGAGGVSAGPVATVVGDGDDRTVTVDACPDGCWLVHGEGFNEAWQATVDGTSLGPPVLVDGGFNGWWLPPADDERVITIRWTAQRGVDVALALSVATIACCLALVVLARRPRRPARALSPPPRFTGGVASPSLAGARRWVPTMVLTCAAALLISWPWGVVALFVGGVLELTRSPARPGGLALAWTGVAIAAAVSVWVAWIERRDRPFPTNGWTEAFEHLHRPTLFAVLCVVVGVCALDADGSGEPVAER